MTRFRLYLEETVERFRVILDQGLVFFVAFSDI